MKHRILLWAVDQLEAMQKSHDAATAAGESRAAVGAVQILF
jgi:hypothetical protein